MDNSQYLQALINAGPDAQNNLYVASFTLDKGLTNKLSDSNLFKSEGNYEQLYVRLIDYTSPKREVSTASLPYQNINIDIVVPSTSLDNHKLPITFRLDDNYYLYELLNKSIPISENGFFNEAFKDSTKWASIKITPLKGSTLSESGICWAYESCYLLGLPSLSYSYDSSSSLKVQCTFLYQKYTTQSS